MERAFIGNPERKFENDFLCFKNYKFVSSTIKQRFLFIDLSVVIIIGSMYISRNADERVPNQEYGKFFMKVGLWRIDIRHGIYNCHRASKL
jgi:hypothetical protein